MQPAPRHYLASKPEHYTVSYRINPWMNPTEPTDTPLALTQWESLHRTYLDLGYEVEVIKPLPGLPDMVYAANGGFTFDNQVYGAKFTYPERQPEAPAYNAWFREHGYTVHEAVEINEGEGDFLLAGNRILAGTGFRTSVESHTELAGLSNREVITLKLVDARFYHLDTALTVLDPNGENIAYLPEAFDEQSLKTLTKLYPDALNVNIDDAKWLGLNAASDGYNIVMPEQAVTYRKDLEANGYNPIPLNLSELLLAGGSVKCCTLELRN